MKIFKSMVAVLVIGAWLAGCANMSDQTRTKAEGTAVGAVVGGLVGLAIGEEKGAAIGALAGAGLGFLVGNEIAKRKKNYASTEEFLDAEIANVQEYNSTAVAYNKKVSREIAALEKESTSLRTKYDKGTVDKKALVAKRNALQKRVEENDKLEKTLAEELKVQTTILKKERKDRPEDDQRIAQLEKEVNALQKNLESLRAGSTQLAKIDQRLSV
ncbi:MAG: glycine zipper 2TM domain-containing protein [Desulfuromonadaceae bacterium]|nr:glycine zipper 2TM domain-containing protein [Desulfuromonadaceae bacterium]